MTSCLNPTPGLGSHLKGPLASDDWEGALLGLHKLLPHHTPQKREGDLWWGGELPGEVNSSVNSSAAAALAPPCWERVRVLLKVVCAARLPLTPRHTPPAFLVGAALGSPGLLRAWAEAPSCPPSCPPPALGDAPESARLQRVLPLPFPQAPHCPPTLSLLWVRPGTKLCCVFKWAEVAGSAAGALH